MSEDEIIQSMALKRAQGIGDITAKKLIATCGSVSAIFKEKSTILRKVEGIGQQRVKNIFNSQLLRAAEDELKFIRKHNIDIHFYKDESYPSYLKQCIDGPILLFSLGNINIKNQPIISIVGSRNISPHGIKFCQELMSGLSSFNPIVVSGFAYGTDITAQKAAMENNLQTIGCLAHGLNQIYPKSHLKYVDAVKQHGGFITDYWSSDPFERTNFLKRNRIIAGMSQATIVIESAEKGGSLVTARIANSYDREVFAVPGRPGDSMSRGCLDLIKLDRAHVLSQVEDIPYILNWTLDQPTLQKRLFEVLEKDESLVYQFLSENGQSLLDLIALRTKMPTFRIASLLLSLELKGYVRPLPGKRFEIC